MYSLIYKTKIKQLPGTRYKEVYKKSYSYYKNLANTSKRRPYVKSKYFKNEKIFLGIFWEHLHAKLSLKDKTSRAKYFPAGVDLIRNTPFKPSSKIDPNNKSTILHRFTGETLNKQIFYVQIKEDQSTNQKYLISIFPKKK